MTENKTRPTDGDVEEYLGSVENTRRREDALTLLPLFKKWTGMNPVLWGDGLAGKAGSAIIGFGNYHYKYASGREGDFFLTGFSPRKQNMAIYIMPGFSEFEEELKRLGPHKHSVSCLYLTNLAKNDLPVLGAIVRGGLVRMKKNYDWKES